WNGRCQLFDHHITFHPVSHKPDAVREHGLALVGGGRRVLLRRAGHLGRMLSFQPASPPTLESQPPQCQCSPSTGSAFLGTPVFWLSIAGVAGLLATVTTLTQKRNHGKTMADDSKSGKRS